MPIRNPSLFRLILALLVALCCAHVAYSDTAPCALLTQAQLSTIVGASFAAGSPIYNTGCSWQATTPTKLMVTVSMQSEKMFAGAKSSGAPGMTNTAVSGIGDEAVFTGVQNFASLWVRKGTKFLLVRIYGLPAADAQTKLKSLATNAVSKL